MRSTLVAVVLLLAGCAPSTAPDVVVETTVAPRAARTVGFDGAMLRLGVLVDLSSPDAELDRYRMAGIETFWAEVNAQGGYDGRIAVELVVRDHGGDPEVAVDLIDSLSEEVAAIVYVSESVVGAVRPAALGTELLIATGSSTVEWESDLALLAVGVPADLVPLALVDADPDRGWCVVTDGGPMGVRVRRSLAVAEQVTGRSLVGLQAEDFEVVADGVVGADCGSVYVEGSAGLAAALVKDLPREVELAGRSSVLFGPAATRREVLLIDDGPEWESEVSEGMGRLRDALQRHTPDVGSDPRVREGYVSSMWLDALLAEGFATGDVSRSRLLDLATTVGPLEFGGLTPTLDVTTEPPMVARQIRLYELTGAEWIYRGAHRDESLDAVAAAVLAAG